jgi:hypothetical protein
MSGGRLMVRSVAVVGVVLVLSGCSGSTAEPVVTTMVSTTTPVLTTLATTTTTTTSTTSTSTTTVDPVVSATAAARGSWEQFRANLRLCLEAYPNCDVEVLLVPFVTDPIKKRLVDSYAKLQADAQAIGSVLVDLELDSTTFEGVEFVNSELTEAILTYCSVAGSREVVPATPTSPEIVVDDTSYVSRIRELMVLEADGVWRIKDSPSIPVDFEGVETCPPET